jgi:hypothetical protein
MGFIKRRSDLGGVFDAVVGKICIVTRETEASGIANEGSWGAWIKCELEEGGRKLSWLR